MLTLDTLDDYLATLDGLRYPDPRYITLLMPAPLEPAANRAALAGQSSCALLARAIWRELGCAHPILAAPYRIGHAVSDVVQIALDAGAWHEPEDDGYPGPGDVLLVGDPGHEHVAIVRTVDLIHGDGIRVESIDGGQGMRGAGIERRTRLWPSWATSWRDVNDLGLDRPVRGWAETARVVG